MFFSNKRSIIKKVSKENIKYIEIYKKGGHVFQLFCDAQKASGTRGLNVNYCVSMLTANGYVPVADDKLLDLPEVKFEEGKEEEVIAKIEKGFEEFRSYVDIIV